MSTAFAWRLGAAPKAVELPEKIFDLGRQLRVRFDADDDFPLFHHCLLTLQEQRVSAKGLPALAGGAMRPAGIPAPHISHQSPPGRCRCQALACW
jgi:hypothetical protein